MSLLKQSVDRLEQLVSSNNKMMKKILAANLAKESTSTVEPAVVITGQSYRANTVEELDALSANPQIVSHLHIFHNIFMILCTCMY